MHTNCIFNHQLINMAYRMSLLVFNLMVTVFASAQKITYAQPNRQDNAKMEFEIIGKVKNNYLVYKKINNESYITAYNKTMEQVSREELDFLPNNESIINADFFSYADFAYMIYQFRRKNIIYCQAVKVDELGKMIGEPKTLDTTFIGSSLDNKVYSVVCSENKKRIMVFKINNKNRKLSQITTLLLDDRLEFINYARFHMPMDGHDDYLDQFCVDNEGDFVFTKYSRLHNENINRAELIVKYALADTLSRSNIPIDSFLLDDLVIKPDNVNNRFLILSFFYLQNRGSIAGYYFNFWDKIANRSLRADTLFFSEVLRREARSNLSIKAAFDDYFINDIILRKDGGFIVSSECYYTTSNNNYYNRWGYPFYGAYDYYTYSPFWYGRYNGLYNGFNNSGSNSTHQADNIMIMSISGNGQKEWNSVIAKEQFDDDGDASISYEIINTGAELHFLFNQLERKALLLNDLMLSSNGKITRNATLKNLDRGYEFLPKYGKQVSANESIFPCFYRNYISFAKIEF